MADAPAYCDFDFGSAAFLICASRARFFARRAVRFRFSIAARAFSPLIFDILTSERARYHGRTMKTFTAALLLVLCTFGVKTAAAADRVQAGQWETTVTVGSGKPMISKYCITPSEAKFMNGDVAALKKYVEQSTAEKTRGRCAVKEVKLDGNRTIVTIVCGRTEVTATTAYHGDHYESTSSAGSTITGKRIGNCP